jgi:hypothetical protein
MSTPESAYRDSAPLVPDHATRETQLLGPPPPEGPPGEIPEAPGHRHRRWLWPLIAGAAALLVLTPLLVYAIMERGSEDTPGTAPAPTPPATAQPSPTQPAPTAPPDGRIPITELWNSTLDIPAWPVDAADFGQSGPVRFTDGQSPPLPPDMVRLYLPEDVGYGDVDGDGAQETVVNVRAAAGEGGSWQVVAFDRDQDGAIITLGQVTATTGPVTMISDHVRVVDGRVEVRVGDYLTCCGDDPTITQWQTRTYAWQSGRFGQVAGPTEFPANPRITDLSLSVEGLTLAAPVEGVRHGTLRVTVTVDRPTVPHRVGMHIWLPAGLEREGTTWQGTRVESRDEETTLLYARVLAPGSVGATRTYSFGVAGAADANLGEHPHVNVSAFGLTADDEVFGEYEAWRDDNDESVPITVE